MMRIFNKYLAEPEFISLARSSGKAKAWYIEIALFAVVFFIGSNIQSVIILPALFIWLYSSDILQTVKQILSGGLPINELFTALMESMPRWLMIVQLYATVITTACALLFCRLIQKRKFSTMGIVKKGALKEALIGLLLGAVLISLPLLLCVVTGAAKITGISTDFNIGILLLFFVGYLLQGFSEEVLCRGYLMTSYARKYSIPAAILVNSAVFAALHLGNGGISPLALINLILVGILFSVYMIKRGNIWGAAGIHAAWNFTQGNILGVKVSGMTMGCSVFGSEFNPNLKWLNGGSFGLEGGLAVTVVLLIATAVVLFTGKKKTDEVAAI